MSTKTRLTTVSCPKCNQTLPGWSKQCQFCGAQLQIGYAREIDPQYRRHDGPSGREVAYIVAGVFVLLSGCFDLLMGFNVIPNDFYVIGGGTFISIFGAGRVVLAIGMLCHQTWAQFLLKWICILSSFGLALALVQSLMFMSISHVGPLGPLVNALQLGMYIFTAWIINAEADV